MKTTKPCSINGIEFDALIEITDSLEAEAPEYPVEDGYNVNDTIILKPRIISITVALSNTPVTWKKRFGDTSNRLEEIQDKLFELYAEKKPVTLFANNYVYENYCITNIQFTRNTDTGYSLEIPITLKEIRTTTTKTTTIPDSYIRAGKSAQNAGTATTGKSKGITSKESSSNSSSSGSSGSSGVSSSSSAESKKNCSILYGVGNLAGLF